MRPAAHRRGWPRGGKVLRVARVLKMPRRFFGVVALLISFAARGQPSIAPQTVEISSGGLHLKAYLWVPPGPGPFPAVLFNHGRSDSADCHWREGNLTLIGAAQAIGPVFARRGYVFLFPFRRGEGPSAHQGDFIGDLLEHEKNTKGIDAKNQLQVTLLRKDHLDDGLASLAFLKRLPNVDDHRIAVIGHSFGGQLTLLEAEHDHSVRAAVTFGAAAASWSGSEELRTTLLRAADGITVPVLLIHAANDYSVAPGYALAREFSRVSKPYELKIYPPIGQSSSEGHNFLYSNVALWETDVFRFIGANTQP
jgi:carboxymethylenebutenolidase